ncbi:MULTISPECIES: hypothetical protein [Enterococcus]|uniref:Uncharacterized protein n=1 Tax=Enterococcus mundtii TaxID=53346 RepID=A0ABQ0V9E2_ENTMU|nr:MULTISPECIES: hypothetical protein [Enterococcus]GEN17271.1 hypothetical protein LAC02_05520 [Ligilactobacillus acidipiscis]MDB7087893.1 hypothetical protein [Enterococcus mundtii]MZZ57473.1 hypothetical protein [Enterococcus mundtii]MZZ60448.1 hypothetical protein [Enterococcus mundtii]MZZ67433.1 hypothetical protein [Enterococcus mundtii]
MRWNKLFDFINRGIHITTKNAARNKPDRQTKKVDELQLNRPKDMKENKLFT